MKQNRPSVNARRKVGSKEIGEPKNSRRSRDQIHSHRNAKASTQASARNHAKAKASKRRAARGSSSHAPKAPSSTSSPVSSPKAKTLSPNTKDFLKEKLLTRRNFLIGAGGLAAIAAVGFGIDATTKASKQAESDAIKAVAGDAAGASSASGSLSVLSVPENAVFTTEACEYIDNPDSVLKLSNTVSLPYGTLIWANDDSVAACLLPTDSSSPLTQIGLLQLKSGNLTTALSNPVGADDGFQIFDVRANSLGAVWVEADILNETWRIYHSGITGGTIANPVLVAEGNDDWETPSIAICGGYSFWQMVPNQVKNKNVSSSKLKSSLMRAPIGAPADSAETIYEAKGYMACAPTSSFTGIAFAPRSDESGTYYQLTHVNAETGEVTDQLTLPASMTPTDVSYGDTGFSFSFDGIYEYGDGISNLGTYTPSAPVSLTTQTAIENARAAIEDSLPKNDDGATPALNENEEETAEKRGISAVADLYSAAEWFRFPRTPLTSPSWCGSWFLVKSTNVVAGVDLTGKRYFTLQATGNGENYGEFLASSGTMNRVVTYANLDYTPINGDPIKECSVRIWNIA